MKKYKFTFALAACLILFIDSAHAVSSPEAAAASNAFGRYDAGIIDQMNLRQIKDYEQRIRNYKEEEHVEQDIEMNKEMKEKLDEFANKTVEFTLNSVHITGNTEYTEEQLMNLICNKIGQTVTINDLVGMANTITEYYQKNGYISTTAYLPPQKVEDGNVEIIVLEGKYGNITIEGNKWARKKYLSATFLKDKSIQEDKVLNIADIQESLREINALDYVKGFVSLQDNEDSEEYTDLTLNVKDRFPIDFDFRFDNQGRSSVGLNRFVIFAGMNNLTGFGDQLLSTTSMARSSFSQGVFYSVPIGRHETKLNVGYSYSTTKLDRGEFKSLDIRGKSHAFFFDVSRRLIKTENYKLYGDVGFDLRNTNTTYSNLGQKVDLYGYRTRSIKLNLTSIKDDVYGKWFGNIGAAKGIDLFGASNTDVNSGLSGKRNPSNRIFKIQASIARLQVLPWRILGIFTANGQWVNRNAWYTDKLQIGGISSVRGFEEGYFLRDYGVTGTAEFRVPIPGLSHLPKKLKFIDDSVRLAAFCDIGWFGDYSKSYSSSTFIMSAGGGLVLKMTRYLSGNVYFGVPIINKPDDASSFRVHFMITSNIL